MKYIGTFTTESGNIYLYDGTSNMVLPINKEIASIVENTVELDRNKIREVANTNIKNIIDKWNLFSKPTSMYLSESEIKHAILEYPYPQLILGITEDCNLRCKYCIFSGNYEYMRHHSPKKMTLECAKKAQLYQRYEKAKKRWVPENKKKYTAIIGVGGILLLGAQGIGIAIICAFLCYHFYDTLSEEKLKMCDQKKAELEALLERYQENYAPVAEKCERLLLDKDEYEVPMSVDYLIEMIKSGRVDTMKEAYDKLDEQFHRWTMEAIQRQQLNAQLEQCRQLRDIMVIELLK